MGLSQGGPGGDPFLPEFPLFQPPVAIPATATSIEAEFFSTSDYDLKGK